MTINELTSAVPVQSGVKPERLEQVSRKEKADVVSFSPGVREKGEIYQAQEIVFGVSDVRADRVEELQKKINDPSYLSQAIIGATADRLMQAFGL